MGQNRKYSYKDVDMIMSAKTIAENFKTNITELATVRTDWSLEYADELLLRIDNVIENNLGVDAKKNLRMATAALAKIQIPAKRDLSFFKIQVDEDFRDDTDLHAEILKTLGFPKHLKKVHNGNQESLIALLYSFKTNMTETLKTTITAKGMNPVIIDRIVGYANTFSNANVSQETLKETTKEITKEVKDIFNSIYIEVIGICKIAAGYYRYEPLKAEQFTFSKAIANLGAVKTSTSKNTETV